MTAATLEKLLLIIFCAMAVSGALFTALTRRVFHSALMLLFTLASIAGLFFMLGAEFPAVLQVLVYVGGVVVLVVFGVMLTGASDDTEKRPLVKWYLLPAAGVGILTAFIVYLFYAHREFWNRGAYTGENYDTMMRELADLLFGKYLLPFEILSVTLLVGLVGALYLARKRES